MANKAVIDELKAQILAIENGRLANPVFERQRDADFASSTPKNNKGDEDYIWETDMTRADPSVDRSRECSAEGDASEKRTAFTRIIDWVNARDRSESYIRKRLAKEGYEPDEIEESIDHAKSCGFIDDSRFAEVLIRSRLSQGKGAAGIERELVGEGIDPFSVEGWPYDFGIDDESEYQRALDVLEKHPSRSKNLRDGAYRKLQQKGFSSSVSAAAARVWSESMIKGAN